MGEIEFALITVVLVILLIYFANRILSKKTIRQKQLPDEEEFMGNPNNLNKIIEGVSLKKDPEDKESKIENETDNEDLTVNKEEQTDEQTSMIEKNRAEATKRINLKDSIISKEILDKKF